MAPTASNISFPVLHIWYRHKQCFRILCRLLYCHSVACKAFQFSFTKISVRKIKFICHSLTYWSDDQYGCRIDIQFVMKCRVISTVNGAVTVVLYARASGCCRQINIALHPWRANFMSEISYSPVVAIYYRTQWDGQRSAAARPRLPLFAYNYIKTKTKSTIQITHEIRRFNRPIDHRIYNESNFNTMQVFATSFDPNSDWNQRAFLILTLIYWTDKFQK